MIPLAHDLPLLTTLVARWYSGGEEKSGCYKACRIIELAGQRYAVKRCKKMTDGIGYKGCGIDICRELWRYHHAPPLVQECMLPYLAWGVIDGVWWAVQPAIEIPIRSEITAAQYEHAKPRYDLLKQHFTLDSSDDFDISPNCQSNNTFLVHNLGFMDSKLYLYDYGYCPNLRSVKTVGDSFIVSEDKPPSPQPAPLPGRWLEAEPF